MAIHSTSSRAGTALGGPAQVDGLPDTSSSGAAPDVAPCESEGLGDFHRLFGDTAPAYALLAVEARAPALVASLADAFRCRGLDEGAIPRLQAAAPSRFELEAGTDSGQVLVAQVGPWALAYLALGRVGADHLVALPALAGDLSDTLETRTLGLTRDAMAGGWEWFVDGEIEERGGWAADGRMTHFESAQHQRPPAPSTSSAHGPQVLDQRVRELSLWVPPLAVVPDGVILQGDSACISRLDAVARLDLGSDPLFGSEAIREASTDSIERPFLDDLLRLDSETDEPNVKARAKRAAVRTGDPPSRLRGMLLRLMGRGAD